MKSTVFGKLFRKNMHWFLLEIMSTYIATKVLLLGNQKISNAIDALFHNTLSECVNMYFWVYVSILVAIGLVFTYLQNMSAKIFSSKMQTGFRRQAAQQLFQLKYQYFDTHASAKVLNNFLDDVRVLSQYYSEIIPIIIATVITVGTILISLFKLDVVLTVLLSIMVPLMIVVSRFVGKRVSDLTKKYANYNDEVSEMAYDAINGIGIVKSYNLENYFKEKLRTTIKKILKFAYRRNEISALAFMTGQLLDYAPQIILGIVALYRVAGGQLSIGEIAYFLLLLDRVVHPLAVLPNYIIEAKIDLVSKHRLEELMNYPKEHSDRENSEWCGKSVEDADEVVSFQNVDFSYEQSVKVLQHINLSIKKGQNVALVGESGGGKSTIFKLLSGFYEPGSGVIRVFGKDVSQCNLQQLRQHIAFVTQDTFLFPDSIAWNVACGDESVDMDRIVDCCKKAGIHEEIMNMPDTYKTNVGERGDRLSGGQKQRVAIARALLKNAELILFDEPTASVDIENEDKIKEVLKSISKEHTIITIAHRLNTIISADCIYVFQNGSIIESGKHEELMNRDSVYRNLYSLSKEVPCE